MGWTNPRTTEQAPFITSGKFDKETVQNLNYLKDSVDNISTSAPTSAPCTMRDGTVTAYASPTGTRVNGTFYQNTSGQVRFITVSASVNTVNGTGIQAFVKAEGASLNICVATFLPEAGSKPAYFTISFMVPATSYYRVIAGDNVLINKWIEWDF